MSACYQSGSVLDRPDGYVDPGPDAGTDAVADAGTDAGTVPDGGTPPPPAECAAFDVSFDLCRECAPNARAYWDGTRCVVHDNTCGCEGDDCDRLYPDIEACLVAHAACPSIVCVATGGTWAELGSDSCPLICGYEHTEELGLCIGGPQCNCGPGRTFGEDGCAEDPSCGMGDLCRATGGHPMLGDGECAEHAICGAVPERCFRALNVDDATSCNCGPVMRFDAELGCVPDDACGEAWREHEAEVCAFSGHAMTAACMPTHCGVPSPLFCAADACECGPYEIFDHYRGCVWSPECRVRSFGQRCGAEEGVCGPGLACCGNICVEACEPTCGIGCDPITQCETSFRCGNMSGSETCDSRTEYCWMEISAKPEGGPVSCEPRPEGCRDCSCLPDNEGCHCEVHGLRLTAHCPGPGS